MINHNGEGLNKEYYYHLSLTRLDNTIFHPRVPKERLSSENDSIPRICVSDSIEGCLTAIKHNVFEDVILQEYRTRQKVPIFVYGIKKSSVQLVATPEEVSMYVSDAIANSEYWILDKEVTLEFISTINLNMAHCVIDAVDCSECGLDINCHGCQKPDDWDEAIEGQWIYRKGCYYPVVDDYELKWV